MDTNIINITEDPVIVLTIEDEVNDKIELTINEDNVEILEIFSQGLQSSVTSITADYNTMSGNIELLEGTGITLESQTFPNRITINATASGSVVAPSSPSQEEFDDDGVLLKSYDGDTPISSDWRLIESAETQQLIYQNYTRLEIDDPLEWINIQYIGSSITDNFIIDKPQGGLFYKSPSGTMYDLVRISPALKGGIIGNASDGLTLVTKDDFKIGYPTHENLINFNKYSTNSQTRTGKIFDVTRRTHMNFVHYNIKFELSGVIPVNTVVRISINSIENGIEFTLVENVTVKDYIRAYNNPSLFPSLLCHIGINEFNFVSPRPIPKGALIKVVYNFTNDVTITGGIYNSPDVEIDNTFVPYSIFGGLACEFDTGVTQEWAQENIFDSQLSVLKKKDETGSYFTALRWDATGGILIGDNNSGDKQTWAQTNTMGLGVSYDGDDYSEIFGTNTTDITGKVFTLSNFATNTNIKLDEFNINIIYAPNDTQMKLMIHDVEQDTHFWKNGKDDDAFAYSVDLNCWNVISGINNYSLSKVKSNTYLEGGKLYNFEISFSKEVTIRGNESMPYVTLLGKEDIWETAVAYPDWEAKTYAVGDLVSISGKLYRCILSGAQITDFQTNLTVGRWESLKDVLNDISGIDDKELVVNYGVDAGSLTDVYSSSSSQLDGSSINDANTDNYYIMNGGNLDKSADFIFQVDGGVW